VKQPFSCHRACNHLRDAKSIQPILYGLVSTCRLSGSFEGKLLSKHISLHLASHLQPTPLCKLPARQQIAIISRDSGGIAAATVPAPAHRLVASAVAWSSRAGAPASTAASAVSLESRTRRVWPDANRRRLSDDRSCCRSAPHRRRRDSGVV